ncbi:Na/Pi cotransporter family protein [Paracoccus benzoatiresistens]|uniref:Na/Pi cotransporter family protein n=1 Tax=Paracoccus benzoatiresistens TaxID=2997341 RepID=A0ABT4J7R3_9RHOB|nr:Na/Pi cotransporter family protein [Paracoccus sp. EF6]MCZ0963169.1 Na/Pi cotransporter family protein [Paracoccus sp. EF6]
MHPFLVLIHLAAAVMLLLWAVRMVRTGVERAFGARLRGAMRQAGSSLPAMAAMGLGLAILLQSATAVGVLATGFAASGLIGVKIGIAALLGADLGSALVVKLLSFDLRELIPALLLVGTTAFLKSERRMVRQAGRIVLGIAFILLSLRMMGEATQPLRDSAVLPQVVEWLAGDPLTAFAVATLLAWGLHSSVATLLIVANFAAGGLLSVEAAAPMVLGANLGGGFVAAWLTRGSGLPARRIPLANLIFRGIGAVAVLLLLPLLPLHWLGGDAAVRLVNLHVLFNLCLLVASLPLAGLMDRLTAQLWPTPAEPDTANGAWRSALDRALVSRPNLALASARRELLRMGETLEAMLRPVMDVLETGDERRIARLRGMDQEINRRHSDIKMFIAELNHANLTAEETRHGLELASLAIDFQAIGDLIARNLLGQATDKARARLRFSNEGWRELNALHDRVMANMQIALNMLVSGNVESARHLVAEKAVLRQMERDCHDRHLSRLRSGNPYSIETSDIHLEVVRALKEINSLLVKVAYPILSEHGHLLETRLAEPISYRMN